MNDTTNMDWDSKIEALKADLEFEHDRADTAEQTVARLTYAVEQYRRHGCDWLVEGFTTEIARLTERLTANESDIAVLIQYRDTAEIKLQRAIFLARHLHAMIAVEVWREHGAEWMGQFEGDQHAARILEELDALEGKDVVIKEHEVKEVYDWELHEEGGK